MPGWWQMLTQLVPGDSHSFTRHPLVRDIRIRTCLKSRNKLIHWLSPFSGGGRSRLSLGLRICQMAAFCIHTRRPASLEILMTYLSHNTPKFAYCCSDVSVREGVRKSRARLGLSSSWAAADKRGPPRLDLAESDRVFLN